MKKAIDQLERLLDSDEVRKFRHLRDGVVRMLLVYGVVGIITALILGASGASDDWIPIVGAFLVIMGVPLPFPLFRFGQSLWPSTQQTK